MTLDRDRDERSTLLLRVTRQLDRVALLETACRLLQQLVGAERVVALSPISMERVSSLVDVEGNEASLEEGGGVLTLEQVSTQRPPQARLGPQRRALWTPLLTAHRLEAVLLAHATPTARFEPSHAELASSLASDLIPALEIVREVENLRELAIRDDTAPCFNRRHLDLTLLDEVERGRRFGTPFSVVFLDMDNLKEINTRYGHATGSAVLIAAAARINESIRNIDRLFRYGGDEFVILLPGTGPDGGREVAERVRKAIESRPLEVVAGSALTLTASAGVASFPDHAQGATELIEAGDAAMRWIKGNGKNAVGIAPERRA